MVTLDRPSWTKNYLHGNPMPNFRISHLQIGWTLWGLIYSLSNKAFPRHLGLDKFWIFAEVKVVELESNQMYQSPLRHLVHQTYHVSNPKPGICITSIKSDSKDPGISINQTLVRNPPNQIKCIKQGRPFWCTSLDPRPRLRTTVSHNQNCTTRLEFSGPPQNNRPASEW